MWGGGGRRAMSAIQSTIHRVSHTLQCKGFKVKGVQSTEYGHNYQSCAGTYELVQDTEFKNKVHVTVY